MQSGYEVEQVFVRKRGGMFELLVVTVAPSGARRRETLRFDAPNKRTAVRKAGKLLASRGDTEDASGVRLRVETRGQLHDDATLQREFISAFDEIWETDG